jgi:integrase
MASVYQRNGKGKWLVKVKDGRGRWKSYPTTARNKTEAKRLGRELELKSERQRMGLEPLPLEGQGTLAKLAQWWLDTYSAGTSSHTRNVSSVTLHIIGSRIASLPASEVTAPVIESYLQSGVAGRSPQTLNHIRSFLVRIFGRARKQGLYQGENPANAVTRRKLPKRLPDYLRPQEVRPVLEAINADWRPLFATALYTGMRKGEMLGLRKADIDWQSRLIFICRSYDGDTTKGKAAAAIPVADELAPHLRLAVQRSSSDLVFPKPDGSMWRGDVDLCEMLRGALARAGVVEGYTHKCRRKSCCFSERHADAALRHCPTCNMKLWPKAHVRRIRFHDLRHTTASLLMMAGANPAAVQRILRHSDPRITTEVYGHLSPGYLRDEVNRLRFEPAGELPDAHVGAAAVCADEVAESRRGAAERRAERTPQTQPQAVNGEAFGAPLVHTASEASLAALRPSDIPERFPAVLSARPAGFEPATYGSGGRSARPSAAFRNFSASTRSSRTSASENTAAAL